jgi:hypothetical protein
MSVRLAAEIWGLVRDALPYDDREQLAEGLVGILVDQGFDLDDISYEFTGDVEVEDAIKYYTDDVDGIEEDYEDRVEEDEDW